MGLYAVLDIFGTKALRNAHVTIFQNMFHCLQRDTTLNYLTKVKLKVVGSVFLEKTVLKNVQFLLMALPVSPYAAVVMKIVIMCLDVNAQHQVIYIYDHSFSILFIVLFILSSNSYFLHVSYIYDYILLLRL